MSGNNLVRSLSVNCYFTVYLLAVVMQYMETYMFPILFPIYYYYDCVEL